MDEQDESTVSLSEVSNIVDFGSEHPPEITNPIDHAYLIRNWCDEDKLDEIEAALHVLPWKMQQVEYNNTLFIPNRETLGMSDTYRLTQNSSTFAIMYPEVIYLLQKEIKEIISNYLPYLPDPVMNYCWGNRYRDGSDSVDEHKDDEDWHLHGDPIISVSFGASRYFDIHDEEKRIKRLTLHHGDILIMKPEFHEEFYHSVPAQEDIDEPRINLTFRSLTRPPKLD